MIDFLTTGNKKSSARLINLIGFVVGAIVIMYDTYTNGLKVEAYGVFMSYCGGVYYGGKYLDKKDSDVVATV